MAFSATPSLLNEFLKSMMLRKVKTKILFLTKKTKMPVKKGTLKNLEEIRKLNVFGSRLAV